MKKIIGSLLAITISVVCLTPALATTEMLQDVENKTEVVDVALPEEGDSNQELSNGTRVVSYHYYSVNAQSVAYRSSKSILANNVIGYTSKGDLMSTLSTITTNSSNWAGGYMESGPMLGKPFGYIRGDYLTYVTQYVGRQITL